MEETSLRKNKLLDPLSFDIASFPFELWKEYLWSAASAEDIAVTWRIFTSLAAHAAVQAVKQSLGLSELLQDEHSIKELRKIICSRLENVSWRVWYEKSHCDNQLQRKPRKPVNLEFTTKTTKLSSSQSSNHSVRQRSVSEPSVFGLPQTTREQQTKVTEWLTHYVFDYVGSLEPRQQLVREKLKENLKRFTEALEEEDSSECSSVISADSCSSCEIMASSAVFQKHHFIQPKHSLLSQLINGDKRCSRVASMSPPISTSLLLKPTLVLRTQPVKAIQPVTVYTGSSRSVHRHITDVEGSDAEILRYEQEDGGSLLRPQGTVERRFTNDSIPSLRKSTDSSAVSIAAETPFLQQFFGNQFNLW